MHTRPMSEADLNDDVVVYEDQGTRKVRTLVDIFQSIVSTYSV